MKSKLAIIVGLALVVTACGSSTDGGDQSAETSPPTEVTVTTETTMPEETSTTEAATPTTPPSTQPEETSVGDHNDGQVSSAAQLEGAKEDLANRLEVDVSEIRLVTQEEIVWPNGALGCPEPGMMYTQALVDGSLVILEVDGQEFEYHGAVGKTLQYCANPAPRK